MQVFVRTKRKFFQTTKKAAIFAAFQGNNFRIVIPHSVKDDNP